MKGCRNLTADCLSTDFFKPRIRDVARGAKGGGNAWGERRSKIDQDFRFFSEVFRDIATNDDGRPGTDRPHRSERTERSDSEGGSVTERSEERPI